MKTTNNNSESNNGMSQVVIDLRPKHRHFDGHGRKELVEVYFRTDVRKYTSNLYTHTEEASREAETACKAYYSEVVELLEAEGWERKTDKYNDVPDMQKGLQRLYCHPQSISGNVLAEDVERLAEKFKAMKSCNYHGTDSYQNCVVTTSPEDTLQLYRDSYDGTIRETLKEMFSTRRRSLYYQLEGRLYDVYHKLAIKVNDWHNDMMDYAEGHRPNGNIAGEAVGVAYVREKVTEAIGDGYMVTVKNGDGLTMARWINKQEEKEHHRL